MWFLFGLVDVLRDVLNIRLHLSNALIHSNASCFVKDNSQHLRIVFAQQYKKTQQANIENERLLFEELCIFRS